jgi:type IV pilus assembly protein PilW
MKHAASSARVSGSRQDGFSVIELMVAMVISLLLLGGVVTIFISSKGTYERVERLSRTQESGRFALDAIVRDIRSAGYMGCSRPSTWANTLTGATTTLAWNFADAILGYEFASGTTWSPARPSGLTSIATGAVNGSDILVLRVPTPAASSATLRLTDKMASGTSTMTIAAVPSGATAPLKLNDVVMLADCHARAVFQITGYNSATGVIDHALGVAVEVPPTLNPGNAATDLGHAFESNSQIVPVRTVAYYVGTAAGRTGLWRVAGGGAPEELVEGVERMELRFGVDTNNDRIADDYVTADLVGGANWGNVISVSVALLVRSPDQYGTERDANTYTLLDKTFTAPSDRYVRQVFVSTATLRNRAL